MIVRNICSRSNEMSAHHRAKSPLTISEMCSKGRSAGLDFARGRAQNQLEANTPTDGQ